MALAALAGCGNDGSEGEGGGGEGGGDGDGSGVGQGGGGGGAKGGGGNANAGGSSPGPSPTSPPSPSSTAPGPGTTPVPTTPLPGPTTPPPGPAGPWSLGQSLTKNWDSGAPGWTGGNAAAFANVAAGSTLVMAIYGYSYPTVPFTRPVDSAGQAVEVAVDTGTARAVQAAGWVLHNAAAGQHAWTNLPNFSTGDGKLFFAEFRRGGAPSTRVLAAATRTLDAYAPPWLTSGSVTMSSGANAGDLLIAFSFEEEAGVGNVHTPYTDPPAGWGSLGVQNQSKLNIAGAACWRNAPDASPQTVSWSWTISGEQDPSLFKAAIFAVH